ncbi:MAG: NADH-quinone oxidoreductase subunit NuoE family protein [Dehalococcoidia bacterium]
MTETTESLPELEQLIADVKPNDADLLAALHRIQDAYGYVPRQVVPRLAEKLHTTPAMVYGAITFYSEFRLEPPARTTISWCSGPACRLKGGENVRRALEAVLGIGLGETTADKAVGLRFVQCDGTCALAPLLRLNGRPKGPLTVSEAIKLARKLKEEGG